MPDLSVNTEHSAGIQLHPGDADDKRPTRESVPVQEQTEFLEE
jgi:hypothetical protein